MNANKRESEKQGKDLKATEKTSTAEGRRVQTEENNSSPKTKANEREFHPENSKATEPGYRVQGTGYREKQDRPQAIGHRENQKQNPPRRHGGTEFARRNQNRGRAKPTPKATATEKDRRTARLKATDNSKTGTIGRESALTN